MSPTCWAPHKRMFGPVWKWAGKIRTTERNIGVEAWRIRSDLQQLVGDTRAWLELDSFPPDEIAVRLHHRLVAIHCFANGNGRHARLVADLLAIGLGQTAFTWARRTLLPRARCGSPTSPPSSGLISTTTWRCCSSLVADAQLTAPEIRGARR